MKWDYRKGHYRYDTAQFHKVIDTETRELIETVSDTEMSVDELYNRCEELAIQHNEAVSLTIDGQSWKYVPQP